MATAAKLRKRAAPRRRTQPVDVRVVGKGRGDDDQVDEVEEFRNVPLFEVVGDRAVDSIMVIRTDPDEGNLGTCPPHFTEMDIKRRWGGGTFKLQARDEHNKPMKGGFRTVTIAGDPLFESATAAAKWKRQQGVEPTMAASASASPTLAEVLQLLKASEQTGRTDADKRITELERRHAMDLERLEREAKIRAQERKEEAEQRERERLERDARDKRERDEREDRLRREAEDREERRLKEAEAARVRDREFSLTLAQLQRGRGDADPTAMLVKGIEIAQKVTGGDLDPLSELARNIPGILQTGKELIRPGTKDDDKTLTLEGPLGIKALQLVEHFKRNGIDPATGLANLFDHVMTLGKQGGGAAPAAAAPAAAAPAAAAPAPAATAAAPPAASKVVPITSRRRRRA